LYKKGKRVPPLLPETLSKPATPHPAPSFISFGHDTGHRSDSRHSFTIITGRFTTNEMEHLLKAMADAPC
jgi:hypothetical protein